MPTHPPAPSHTHADLAPLLGWYRANRRALPWRASRDPYAIWISEAMLQQTRVETALPFYERFLAALPTVASLAEASEAQVLSLWSGLGYYRRARLLHAAARRVVEILGGQMPQTAAGLRELEGVGAYTAGAIASIAFGEAAPLVDGNVARVLARLFGVEDDVRSAAGQRALWALADRLVKGEHRAPGDWNQALMELGATVCAPRSPACGACPVAAACVARATGRVDRLPVVAAKRPARRVERVAVVLASRGRVLLARRRPGGLFAGLWEPPSIDREPDADPRRAAASLGLGASRLREAGVVDHVLTHRRMHLVVLAGALPARRTWRPPSGEYDAARAWPVQAMGELPTSTLARKLLAAAGVVAERGVARGGRAR